MVTDWAAKARALADELARSGDLVSPEWREALCAVPRHELVPYYYVQNEDMTWTAYDGSEGDREAWLSTVYSNTTLVTALVDVPEDMGAGQLAVSSSTMPGLMVRMLEALDVADGHRVLEIGTGTGYNAALLSHRLGSENVYSVDVDGELVELARKRLAALGYAPTLVTRDGAEGLAEYAPYDRIIATCAVCEIPRTWIEQTREDGLILVDLKPSVQAGNLVLLRRRGDTATGRFLSKWAGFLPMRRAGEVPLSRRPRRDREHARTRWTTAPLEPWLYPVPWLLAQCAMPPNLTSGRILSDTTGGPAGTFLAATDGSWCEVSAEVNANGTRRVLEGGPTSLWQAFEDAYEQWRSAGEPGWDRLGLTVTADQHVIWLDEPDGTLRWSLAAARDTREPPNS